MSTRGFIHFVHLFIFGSLFLYVGIQRTNIPLWLFSILFVMSIVVLIYHLFKTYIKYSNGNNPWVNLIHIFLVFPVLATIGYYKTETPRYVFELLLLLGFSVAGYHGFYLLYDMNIIHVE